MMVRRPITGLGFLLASIASMGLAAPASAGLIASDSYAIGTDPTAGQYQAGVSLMKQPSNLSTLGFVNGAFAGGSLTSNFQATAGGLAYAPYDTPSTNDGKVSWTGAAADGMTRSNGRSLNPVASSGSYWFHIIVSQDGTTAPSTNGYVLAGLGNTVPPLLGATVGNNEGLFFGFAQHGTANDAGDLVIRYRDGASTTADAILVNGSTSNTAQVYDIIARLDVNVGGGSADNLTYWVNAKDYSSQAALDATSLVTNDTTGPLSTLALQSSSDFQRMTYSATNWTGRANFDELRFGTTLADVAPSGSLVVPEPASVAMTAIGLLGGLGLTIRRRRALA